MIENLFAIFLPFKNRVRTWLFTKADQITSDQQAADILGFDCYASLHQVHGNRTVVIREPSRAQEKADAIATNRKNLLLIICMADCQTFVVVEPKRNVVGLIHAGWRGINAGVIPAFYEKLNGEWGIEPRETFVGAGPSLCVNCAEFTDPVKELPNVDSRFFVARMSPSAHRYYGADQEIRATTHGRTQEILATFVDLQSAATTQFLELGVKKSRLERHPDCTRCHPETYWTYRGGDRKKVNSGYRNVLACMLI